MFCFVVFSADRFTINNLLNVLFVAVQDTIVVFPIDKYNSYFSVWITYFYSSYVFCSHIGYQATNLTAEGAWWYICTGAYCE